jgi:hypothetical protein
MEMFVLSTVLVKDVTWRAKREDNCGEERGTLPASSAKMFRC